MMTDDATLPPPPRCEARTGVTPGAFGFLPVWCEQTRGLRSLIDNDGRVHLFCPAPGHAEAVALRFGAIANLLAANAHDEHHDLYDRFDDSCPECERAMDRAQEAAFR